MELLVLSKIARELSHEFKERKKTLGLVESCTGGAISAALVQIPGASDFLLGSLVVYSNDWKKTFLKVSTLEKFGAVSRETVIEMASHLLEQGKADFVAAISGIAGPQGGTPEKPIGTVWIAVAERGKIETAKMVAHGNRQAIIEAAAIATLSALLKRVRGESAFS